MSSLPCKLAVRFVGLAKDVGITQPTIQPIENVAKEFHWKTRARKRYAYVCYMGSVYIFVCVYISRSESEREKEREAFVVFVERRWKAIPANENKRSDRPLDEPTGVRVTVESLKRVDRGIEPGKEGGERTRSKANAREAAEASTFHPWSIRKLALLSSFYRA